MVEGATGGHRTGAAPCAVRLPDVAVNFAGQPVPAVRHGAGDGTLASVADVVAALDRACPPGWAEDWDAVGLVVGDPAAPVTRVLLAVDPVAGVVAEARDAGAQLVLTHHPLFLRGVHGIARVDAAGRVADDLARARVALLVAHTNADVARPGVSDALATVAGLAGAVPLRPGRLSLDKLTVFVPADRAEALVDALALAGAGQVGNYERCAFLAPGTGMFRPTAGARPFLGEVGERVEVAELRLEMVVPRGRRTGVVAALRAAHPYEEPAFDLVETVVPGRHGLGRVGDLAGALPLRALAGRLSRGLPRAQVPVRFAGDANRVVQRVAVCGGAGGELVPDALAAGADVLVTADLRHHVVSDAVAAGLALIDVGHWASEWPWLAVLARLLGQDPVLAGVEFLRSEQGSDPWSGYVEEPGSGPVGDPHEAAANRGGVTGALTGGLAATPAPGSGA